jgi:tetratricopeptide (TPR) repeat protein
MKDSGPQTALPAVGRAPHRSYFLWLLGLLVAASAVAGGAWYALRPAPPPAPPAVDLSAVDRDVAEAIEAARQAVQTTPRSARAWGKLGTLLVAHDFRGEGNACFAEAERLDPHEPRWPYLQGVTLEFGAPEQAIPKLRRAVELGGTDSTIRLRLAETLLSVGQVDEAETVFRAVNRAEPDNPRALLGLGRVASARGETDATIVFVQRAAETPFARKAAHILLAQAYGRLPGKEEEAERERQIIADLPPDPGWPDPYVEEALATQGGKKARVERANRLRHQGRVRDALALMREATLLYPDSDFVWQSYGHMLLDARDYRGAERAFIRAIELAPDRFEQRFRLGTTLYYQKGRLSEAAEAFRAATRVNPNDARALFSLGRCLQELREVADRPEALAAYRAAIRCRPNYAEAHRNLGQLLADTGREATCVADLLRILHCPAALDLAMIFRVEALAHYRAATQLKPSDAETRSSLATLLRECPPPSMP